MSRRSLCWKRSRSCPAEHVEARLLRRAVELLERACDAISPARGRRSADVNSRTARDRLEQGHHALLDAVSRLSANTRPWRPTIQSSAETIETTVRSAAAQQRPPTRRTGAAVATAFRSCRPQSKSYGRASSGWSQRRRISESRLLRPILSRSPRAASAAARRRAAQASAGDRGRLHSGRTPSDRLSRASAPAAAFPLRPCRRTPRRNRAGSRASLARRPRGRPGGGPPRGDIGCRGCWARNAGGAQIGHRLVGFALGQQDPSESIVDLRRARRGGNRPLGQSAGFGQIALLLVEPSQIVERGRIGRTFGNDAVIFGNGLVVFLFLEIERGQSRADLRRPLGRPADGWSAPPQPWPDRRSANRGGQAPY